MPEKLPLDTFEWVENISDFDESFIKSCNEEIDEGYSLEVDIQFPEKLHEFIKMIYHFNQKKLNLKNSKSLLLIYTIKLNTLFTKDI